MKQAPQAPPASPGRPAPPVSPGEDQGLQDLLAQVERMRGQLQRSSGDPAEVLRAARAQREELRDQRSTLEDRRRDLVQESQSAEGVNKAGIDRRIAEIDQRISEVDKQIAAADLQVAKAAGIPGAVVPDPAPPPDRGPPEGVVVLSGLFIVFVLFPLAFAQARRIWKRTAKVVLDVPQALVDRLTRLDQAVDTIAIEVERISEGQRFLTKVMTEGPRSLGPGPAQPIEVHAREAAPVPRTTGR